MPSDQSRRRNLHSMTVTDRILPPHDPNRAAFLEIAGSDHVAKIGEHRAAGLESQWLIATTESRIGG